MKIGKIFGISLEDFEKHSFQQIDTVIIVQLTDTPMSLMNIELNLTSSFTGIEDKTRQPLGISDLFRWHPLHLIFDQAAPNGGIVAADNFTKGVVIGLRTAGATSADEGERILGRTWLVSPRCDVVFGNARLRGKRSAMLDLYDESVIKEYCEDDDLLILPAGLGPVKSRQDDLKYCKIREETNGMNFKKYFFRTSDCIENDTTMEDDSFRQESPVNTSRKLFFS
ncbi:hypothetical protein TNCV_3196951 [Trichonephila clavipes]|nr:hypothetical protein TNCV_3196951 [Trichonephila clavipes]